MCCLLLHSCLYMLATILLPHRNFSIETENYVKTHLNIELIAFVTGAAASVLFTSYTIPAKYDFTTRHAVLHRKLFEILHFVSILHFQCRVANAGCLLGFVLISPGFSAQN